MGNKILKCVIGKFEDAVEFYYQMLIYLIVCSPFILILFLFIGIIAFMVR